MLRLVSFVCLILFLVVRKWRTWQLQEWVREQLDVASFRYAGEPNIRQRLHLRATENRRLKGAFGIDNSLTTESLSTHQAFLKSASRVLNKGDRSWEELYGIARTLIDAELETAADEDGQPSLRLAESVRCMILAVVLFDSFGVDPTSIPRSSLVTITQEINKQWLQSKCHPDDVAPSQLLNWTIAALNIKHPFSAGNTKTTPAEVLSLLMPQYETLWRVVLLTFVTAYHHQPDAHLDAEHRTATVPSCLGNPAHEQEALKLAKVSPHQTPNQHPPLNPPSSTGRPPPLPLQQAPLPRRRPPHPSGWPPIGISISISRHLRPAPPPPHLGQPRARLPPGAVR
jgi:hypothetical protein